MVNKESIGKWLFVSDVDDTILGDEKALEILAGELDSHRQDILIAYNSSRPCASMRLSLIAHPTIPEPDFMIGALGTEIEDGQTGQPLLGYSQSLKVGWDRPLITRITQDLCLQPHQDEFQTPLKASYNLPNEELYRKVLIQLEENHIRAKIIYSGGKNLDLIPQNADKGAAVVFLKQQINILSERVVVAGDSGNDLDMFSHNFKGIVVGNADQDLKKLTGANIYQAKAAHAAGVLEGLRFWSVIP